MSTREVTLNEAQIRMIRQWAQEAWHDLDQERMMTIPNSPKEAAVLADQLDIELLRDKLRRP